MKYALSLNDKIEATPEAQGTCPCCGSDMVAKCGTQKVWHWAHKGKRECDHWWENETEWHRDWKNKFPKEWQEVVHFADDGEKHIADVKTPDGLVIEFQHSSLNVEEKSAREKFYKNMVWVVDGKRTKTDYSRFDREVSGWQGWPIYETTNVQFPEWKLPKPWLNRKVPVIIDWGLVSHPYLEDVESDLVCILPQQLREDDDYASLATCFLLKRNMFAKMVKELQKIKIPLRTAKYWG